MQWLAEIFIAQPLHILVVALFFLLNYGVLRRWGGASRRRTRPLLLAASSWIIYAAWEWLVLVRTPEANIRLDLLLIWPLLAPVTLFGLIRPLFASRATIG